MCLWITVFLLLLAFTNANKMSNTLSTTTVNPVTAFQKPQTAMVYPTKLGNYKKRDVQVHDVASTSSLNNYASPLEYYRGPDSSATLRTSLHSSASSTSPITTFDFANHHDSTTDSFFKKPITFPNISGRSKYQDSSSYPTKEYNKWQIIKGGERVGGVNAQDRSTYSGGNGASYDTRPYDSGSHFYESNVAGVSGGGGYYASSDSSAGIPFNVYANKGGDVYSYTHYPVIDHEAAMKGHPELSQKALLAKSFLIPLASAAVLGIAAALVSNPLLLQLGTVGNGVAPALIGKRRRRRRRRELDEIKAMQKQSMGSTLAYPAHSRQNSKIVDGEKKM